MLRMSQAPHDKDKDKDAAQAAPMFLYFWDHRLEGGEEDDGGLRRVGLTLRDSEWRASPWD